MGYNNNKSEDSKSQEDESNKIFPVKKLNSPWPNTPSEPIEGSVKLRWTRQGNLYIKSGVQSESGIS